MAVDALTGLPGGGKSYQAVVEIILPALAAGRRVVTNIEGLNDDVIYDRLETSWGVPADNIGEIVHVTDDQVINDNFYYCPVEDFAKLKLKADFVSVVRPGDLVVIDEAWAFYESKVSPVVMNFFRKHRHFVNEKNVSCNVVLITQDVMDIGLKVRRVISQTTVTTKLTAVGLSGYYSVKIFSKFDLRSAPIFEGKGTYKKENFELYDSYSFKSEQEKKNNRTGVEKKSDKRGNIWANKSIRYGLPLAFIILSFFIYKFFHFFSKDGFASHIKTGVAPPPPVSPIMPSSPIQNTGTPPTNPNQPVNAAPVVPAEPKESSRVGVQGYYQVGDKLFVALKVGDKQRVIVEPKDFKVQDTIRIEGIFQNEIVNTYTGQAISLQPDKAASPIGTATNQQKGEITQKVSSSVH
ncbi:MAG: hypothetical protein RIT27_99 [Pseudomonadota bacterium]|jgi:zona occludens toxin